MQNFTLVYNDCKMVGSHQNIATRIERIKTNNLKKVIDNFGGAVVYVFLGHPEIEGETEGPTDWLKVKTYKYK